MEVVRRSRLSVREGWQQIGQILGIRLQLVPVFQVLFMGRLVPQKGQSALVALVHRTSLPRVGPPHLGQVMGSHSSG